MHRHFQHTLLIFYRPLLFAQRFNVGYHGHSTCIEFDSSSCVADVETKVEDILDCLAETSWVDHEFEEVDRRALTEELANGSDQSIGCVFLLWNIPFFQLQRSEADLEEWWGAYLLGTNDGKVCQFLSLSSGDFSSFLFNAQGTKDEPHGWRTSTNPHGKSSEFRPVHRIVMVTIVHAINEMPTTHKVDKFGDVFIDVECCVAKLNVSCLLFGEVRSCDEQSGVEVCYTCCTDYTPVLARNRD